ncbi:hypothetical protein ERO13_D02G074701v2 [Gossypium hirsutum]|nr:hypothetical protein ERO13_D02G074701v2 [Gossypium hirsutum]
MTEERQSAAWFFILCPSSALQIPICSHCNERNRDPTVALWRYGCARGCVRSGSCGAGAGQKQERVEARGAEGKLRRSC